MFTGGGRPDPAPPRLPRLWVARDGARVVAIRDDHLCAHDLKGGLVWTASLSAPPRAVGRVGDELWIVERDRAQLSRIQVATGEPCAEPATVEGLVGQGALFSAFHVPAAAVWVGESAMVLRSERTGIGVTVLRGRADIAIPQPDGEIIVGGGVIRRRRAGADTWRRNLAQGEESVAVELLFDGRGLLLVRRARQSGAYHLMVLATRDGSIHHSLAVKDARSIAVAPIRGHALVLVGPRRLVQVDLRFGRVLRARQLGGDAEEVAADPHGELAFLRGGAGIETLALEGPEESVDEDPADTSGASDSAVSVAPAPEPPAAEEPAVEVVSGPAPAWVRRPLRALGPRDGAAGTTADEAIRLLDAHAQYVAAMVERAVADSWDRGTLALPSGEHPFQGEVRGILGCVGGRAEAPIVEAESHLRAARDSLLTHVSALGDRRGPLAELAIEFGLSRLAADILMVVAAPVLRGELARLYGILSNDTHRALCDELLVTEVMARSATRDAVARELDHDQPLLRHGLLVERVGRGRPFNELRADPLVIRRLRGQPLDTDLPPYVRCHPATIDVDDLVADRQAVVAFLEALAAGGEDGPARLVVQGRLGSGRRTLLAATAAMAGRVLGVIDASAGGREDGSRAEIVARGLVECALRGWLPCLEGLDHIAEDDHEQRSHIRGVIRRHPGPVALRLPLEGGAPLDPGHLTVVLPPLRESVRVDVWRAALERHDMPVPLAEDLAARFRIGPGVVERVCLSIARRHAGATAADPVVATELLIEGVRQNLESRLGATATRVARLARWSDVVLPPDVLDSLVDLVGRVRHRRVVFERWGFDRVMSTSRGITALFQGSPGTGKTMVAGVIARELGMDIYRIDLSRIVSKWIGETERNLATLFDAAEDGQAILLFDEADSLFARRTEVRTSVDRYANLEVNYLLQRIDAFEGIAILTTNFGTAIDSAFKRRLSVRLTFPFPDEEMREKLWSVHLPPELPREGRFDLAALARRYQIAGGYIRNAAVRAAFLAAEEQAPLTQDHLERAIRAEFREIGKLSDSGTLE